MRDVVDFPGSLLVATILAWSSLGFLPNLAWRSVSAADIELTCCISSSSEIVNFCKIGRSLVRILSSRRPVSRVLKKKSLYQTRIIFQIGVCFLTGKENFLSQIQGP